MPTQSLSKRFVEAYNHIDRALHDIYNLKPSISFSDAVRHVATMSSVVRKYEDVLVTYGRLRNAIIHNSTEEIIAEPHQDVVEKFEHIERLLTKPPKALQAVGNRAVTKMSAEVKVCDLISQIYRTGFSNMPVYLDKTLVGVINRKMIVDAIGLAISKGEDINALLNKKIIDAIEVGAITAHYEVVSENTTIDEVLFLFQQNRRLSTVIITKNGDYSQEPLGIVATADVIDIQNILDNY